MNSLANPSYSCKADHTVTISYKGEKIRVDPRAGFNNDESYYYTWVNADPRVGFDQTLDSRWGTAHFLNEIKGQKSHVTVPFSRGAALVLRA